jgi:hypothetical protein
MASGMILKVRIFLNTPSGCSCCNSQQDSTLIRCFAFIKNLKSQYGDEVDIDTLSLNSNELDKYLGISELKARKKLKSPVILVNDVIKSIGRYPDKEELIKWKPGEEDS